MSLFAVLFLFVNIIFLFLLPRHKALIPILVGTCYMTLAQGIELGPFSFPLIRLLFAAGFLRVLLRGEWKEIKLNRLDHTIILWGCWLILSSLLKDNFIEALVYRLGLTYNAILIYFLIRVFCQTFEECISTFKFISLILIPIALEMLMEHLSNRNYFSVFGGVSQTPIIREGNIRAQGPFAHPILAGTVGAVTFPLMLALWKSNKKVSIAGILSSSLIVIFSSSSGPLASYCLGLLGILSFRYRHKLKLLRVLAVVLYAFLDLVMKAPAYFLMARIPLVAGSTGWHRARLIESAFEHLDEWWLCGTDYTRHWMPTGVSWSKNHTDITNHYLQMGVNGGLGLIIIFIFSLYFAFSYIGKLLITFSQDTRFKQFFCWMLGVSVFSITATMISVSFFDQSLVFLYLPLALIGSLFKYINIETNSN